MYAFKRAGAAIAVGVVASTLTIGAVPSADAAARHFSSCKALNHVYTHGVGRVGAHDKTSGVPVTNFKRSGPLYLANNGPRTPGARTGYGEYDLDRDNDGISCEKA